MSFEKILSQEHAVRLLKAALNLDRAASAYLFFGPGGVGKRLSAVAFARALLCAETGGRGDACGSCPACVRSAAGSHPGLSEVSVLPGKSQIGIGQIQELSRQLSLRPLSGERTIVILDEAERTSPEGLNALLKTLEEPAPGATLILVTSSREALPETIRSRCQGVRFRPLPSDLIRRFLGELEGTDDDEADFLAGIAGGSFARARELKALGLFEALQPVLTGKGPLAERLAEVAARGVDLVGDRNLAVARGKADAFLRYLLDSIRGEVLSEDPAVAGLEDLVKLIVDSLDRIRLNVSPEPVLRALSMRMESTVSP